MTDAPMPELIVVRRFQDFPEVFRALKDWIGLTNEFCDDVGGLTKGHTDKILGPSQAKSCGGTTFDMFCEMLAVEFHAKIDLEAAKRMADVWEGRKRPLYPAGKVNRISPRLMERAKPHVISDFARNANTARNAMLSGEHRSKIARKAAKARWRKARRNAAKGSDATAHRGATSAPDIQPAPSPGRAPRD